MQISNPYFKKHWSIELFLARKLHSSANTWLALPSSSQIILDASISLSFVAGEHSSSVRFSVEKDLDQLKFVLLYLFHAFNSCWDYKYGSWISIPGAMPHKLLTSFFSVRHQSPAAPELTKPPPTLDVRLPRWPPLKVRGPNLAGGACCPGLWARILYSLANWSTWAVVSSSLDTLHVENYFFAERSGSTKI